MDKSHCSDGCTTHDHTYDWADAPTGPTRFALQVLANGALLTVGLFHQDNCPVEPGLPVSLLGNSRGIL